jgi:hypothetical protein
MTEIPEESKAIKHSKKLRYGHLLRPGSGFGSGSDQKGPDPTGSATLGTGIFSPVMPGIPVH